ncbi:MAG TPA: hypothetical protein DCO72_05980 [Ruminococcus sp.]|nr:hypothetical protein [Ruminococcus sp.]
MQEEQYRKNAYDMIYLAACAVNQKVPDEKRIQGLDLPSLFSVCQEHILTACVAYALESAGIHERNFTQAKEKSVRKNILFDAERKKVLAELEKEHIWYMPLKGAIIKDWYPRLGMRQMSDNDILCDGNYRSQIRKIMLRLGFTCEHYEEKNDDAYFKPPVCNFEMHDRLFIEIDAGNACQYYKNVKDRLIKDENSQYGYHFRMEDFYIYVNAHEYKHYSDCGTGVRSLLDTYIIMRKFHDEFDWNYISGELKKLETFEFEQQSRELAMKLFNFQELTEEEKSALDYYIFSGVYGKIENKVDKELKEDENFSKAKYIFRRIFIPIEDYKAWFPWAYRHKCLIPVAWAYRLFRGVFVRHRKFSAEMKHLMKQHKDK